MGKIRVWIISVSYWSAITFKYFCRQFHWRLLTKPIRHIVRHTVLLISFEKLFTFWMIFLVSLSISLHFSIPVNVFLRAWYHSFLILFSSSLFCFLLTNLPASLYTSKRGIFFCTFLVQQKILLRLHSVCALSFYLTIIFFFLLFLSTPLLASLLHANSKHLSYLQNKQN